MEIYQIYFMVIKNSNDNSWIHFNSFEIIIVITIIAIIIPRHTIAQIINSKDVVNAHF